MFEDEQTQSNGTSERVMPLKVMLRSASEQRFNKNRHDIAIRATSWRQPPLRCAHAILLRICQMHKLADDRDGLIAIVAL
jgi:hypothetical protein